MNFKKAVRFLLALAVLSMATPGNTLLAEDNAAIPGTKCPQKVAVLIETVKPTIFLEYQYFYGQGQAEIVAIKSPVSGLLSEIKVSEGSLVDVGQDLVVLNAGMGEEIKKLEAATVKTKKILTARQNMKEKNEKAIQAAAKDYQKALDLLNKKKALANLIVEAPLAGIVHLIMAVGSEMAADALLMEISNPRQMIFQISLTASDKGLLAIGDKFVGTTDNFSGEIAAEAIAVSETQAALRVNNNENQVKEGVKFFFKKLKTEHADAITIPTKSIQKDSLGHYVYVVDKKKAKKLYLTLGAAAGEKTMVLKGLAADTQLIISGFECLVDGKKIRISNQEELAKEKNEALTKLKDQEATKTTAKTEEILPLDKSRFRVGLTFGRFTINDTNLRGFYLNWFQNIPGIEFSFQAIDNIDIWAAGKIYADKNLTTYYANESKLTLIPLSLGLRYRPRKFGAFEPFVGAGLNYYSYSETISGETDLEPTKGTAFGFHFQGGSYFHFNRFLLRKIFPKNNVFLLGEIFLKYNIVKKTLAEMLPDGTDKLDLGGMEMGIGIVVKF
jgi:membrane fusion protein (multidrug efflux system)